MASYKHKRHIEHIVGVILIVMSLLLVIWIFRLGTAVAPGHVPHYWPRKQINSGDWRTTWVGLDSMEAIGLFITGFLLRMGKKGVRTMALLSIPVFLLDAWFDVMTAVSKNDTRDALLMAILVELPTAALLAWVAKNTKR
jgi:hypothetical protein